jgi:cytochrome P450
MQSLGGITLRDPQVIQNPYPYYERLRIEDPVHFDEGINTWLITRYDDLISVARDTETFSDEMKVSNAMRSPHQADADEWLKQQGYISMDPADSFKVDGNLHARRRKLVAAAFAGPMVSKMEARVATICRERAGAFLSQAQADLVREYARPIPIMVICDALGLPMDRIDEISRGADSGLVQLSGTSNREEAMEHARNVLQLQRFTREAIERRRANPGQDLISQIVYARIDDPQAPKLSDREVLAISSTVISGGVDTTRNGIAFGLHALATQPGLMKRLRESKDQDKELARFIDETLRFYTPVPQLPRVTTRETELRGKVLQKDAFVLMCWASGNRDCKQFANPDTFDIDRPKGNYHLAFGTGVHHCLGAILARQEMKCAFREIINNVESLELAVPEEEIDFSTSLIILRTLASLPLRIRRPR